MTPLYLRNLCAGLCSAPPSPGSHQRSDGGRQRWDLVSVECMGGQVSMCPRCAAIYNGGRTPDYYAALASLDAEIAARRA